jgi:catechol 2,3-dioxygenase-like lactoylglutathione lyase family enzyme
MTIGRIHHVQITIPPGAEDAAHAFYCGVLGLAEIPKPESLLARGGFWVQLGDQQIHIGTEPRPEDWFSKAHIAYQVSDLDHWRDRLLDAGCDIGESVPIPGYARFETRDPFGNRLEFIQPLS